MDFSSARDAASAAARDLQIFVCCLLGLVINKLTVEGVVLEAGHDFTSDHGWLLDVDGMAIRCDVLAEADAFPDLWASSFGSRRWQLA
jgi:hypothetical protein